MEKGEPHLVNNYEMALKRLKTQEQSLLRKSPEIAQAYDKIIKDYERKEYITKVPKTNDTEQWFLPHFPVIRQERATTKVRIVFDAAAKENGKCLNDAVRAGPKLQRELIDVLTRFRRAPIALSGDISEMFLQVGLSEEDQRYYRFLWRNLDPTKEPDHYEFKRLLFANRAFPFCSQHVVLTHAKAHATDYPHAAETVNDSMYVDDVLDSCEMIDEAVQLRRELSELFALGNFKLRKWSSNDPAVLNDIPATDLKSIVEDFNNYFTSVGKITAATALDLANKNNIVLSDPMLNSEIYPTDQQFNFEPVTCSEIRRIIMAMPRNKSPGPDKISMFVIKDCLPVILGPLTNLINSSLTLGEFPDKWKLSEVIPLHKEGDQEIPSNNRPLSLLEVLSKVCERVALDQFSSYITENQRLSPHQNGNRKHHSTETLNIFIIYKMLEAMDKKHVTALILLDLSKAFDSINHTILLHKLKCVGASPLAIQWFESYLSDRSQYVRIGSTVSSTSALTHGVPQGSILSPFLFGIYVNDLPAVTVSSDLDSYVDDSKLHLAFLVDDVQQSIAKLEKDLYKTAKWCLEHQLLINPDKTKFILVGTRSMLQNLPTQINLKFLGKTPVSVAKDLGMHLDLHLSYEDHISKLSSTCINKLCQISRVKESFDKKTLLLLIEALVINKLLYSSSMWANTSSKNLKKLQTVQNFACRIITGIKKFDHVTSGLQELNWLSIENLLIYKDTIMAYKCLNNFAPSYLANKFTKRYDIHNCQTRNNHCLNIPSFKTTAGQRTFHYRAVKIWNDIDDELKKIPELKVFKKKLKEHFLNS